MTARECAEALRAAARRLEELAAVGEGAELFEAVEAREAAFTRLHELVGDSPPAELRECLVEVREIDARLFQTLPEFMESVRLQRQQLGQARDAAQAVRPQDAPRFFEVRV